MEDSMMYQKRSVGQWVAIYAVIGLVVYGAIYYFYLKPKNTGGGYGNAGGQTSQSTDPSYKTDERGMTLYVFDEDSTGASNCYDQCAINWPPYLVKTGEVMPEGMSSVDRNDGSKQYALAGRPLYYYIKDTKVGDVLGDGVGGTWHLAK